MKQKQFKRCPRCDKKTPIYQDRCEGCGLIFSRLSKATNRAAKKNIQKKQYNKVIMDTVLPSDVNKWKLFFTALFLGFFGVHYASVGRYKMFTYGIVSAAGLYIAVFLPQSWFNHQYLFLLMWALVLPASIYTIINIVSIFSILTNKFKVPISIDEELVADSLDKEIVDDILKVAKQPTEEKSYVKVENQNKKQDKNNKNDLDINKEADKKTQLNENVEQSTRKTRKAKKITVICSSCGETVKVYEGEKICPKCDEPLKED